VSDLRRYSYSTAELADQLEKRGTVPECFAGVLIGITEVERQQIVAVLRGVPGPNETRWISVDDRLPEEWTPDSNAPMYVLAWFPGMEVPHVEAANQVRWWAGATHSDPIPGVMWMPVPSTPATSHRQEEK
jgi:hypothetical protein